MADKKPDKKGDKKPAAPAPRPIEIILAEIIIIAGLILAAFGLFNGWFDSNFFEDSGRWKAVFIGIITSAQVIAAFASLLFIMGIMYAKFRIGQIERAQKLHAKVKEVQVKKETEKLSVENKKWQRVLEHISSPNSSDWRLSILEADIILGELLTKNGYLGETIADQLKDAGKSGFRTLDDAWEAHKVRNRVAHDGADFPLSNREAKRIIGLFERVFKEFYFI